jgi:DNA polymerase elongation subunit (family B)
MESTETYSSLRKEELLERHNQITNKINLYNNLQQAYKLIGNSGYGAL